MDVRGLPSDGPGGERLDEGRPNSEPRPEGDADMELLAPPGRGIPDILARPDMLSREPLCMTKLPLRLPAPS